MHRLCNEPAIRFSVCFGGDIQKLQVDIVREFLHLANMYAKQQLRLVGFILRGSLIPEEQDMPLPCWKARSNNVHSLVELNDGLANDGAGGPS